MGWYRIYSVTDSGRVLGPPSEVQFADDGEALRHAEHLLRLTYLEIWSGARLVAKLSPTPRHAPDRQASEAA
jgi:hypothetical protein